MTYQQPRQAPRRIDCGAFVLRPWRHDDHEALIRHASDRSVWLYLRDAFPHPYTGADADAWLARAGADPPLPWTFAIEIDGEACGTVGLTPRDDIERGSAEIGYWLGAAHRGRGIVTAAVRAVTEAALTDGGLIRVFAYVFSTNPASARVLEKAGYEREGVLRRSGIKDGILIDRIVFAATRDPGLPYVPAF